MKLLKIVSFIALLLGLGGIVWGFVQRGEEQQIATKGVPAIGIVTHKETVKRDIGENSSRSNFVTFNYPVEGRGRLVVRQPVSDAFYARTEVGTELHLHYLKEDPKKILISGERAGSFYIFTFGIVVTALGLVGPGMIYFKKIPATQ